MAIIYFVTVGGFAALAFVLGLRRQSRPKWEDPYQTYKRTLRDRTDLDGDTI